MTIGQYGVDEGFFDAMGLKLLAGRWFDRNRPMDDQTFEFPIQKSQEIALAQRGVNVVLNQYAVKKLGFASPQDAVGKVLKSELFEPGTGMVEHQHHRRRRRHPLPLGSHADRPDHVFGPCTRVPAWMIVRYRGDPATVEGAIERQWKQVVNDVPFQAKFSEDIMRELYKAEDSRAKIFAAFALLAVIIGCLGLFGLAAFTAERRTKEIGIRKVLGARLATSCSCWCGSSAGR